MDTAAETVPLPKGTAESKDRQTDTLRLVLAQVGGSLRLLGPLRAPQMLRIGDSSKASLCCGPQALVNGWLYFHRNVAQNLIPQGTDYNFFWKQGHFR